jgi:hypothetical protein
MTITLGLYLLTLLVLAVVCALGVFHKNYDDTVLQRIGMVGVIISAVAEMNVVWNDRFTSNPRMMLVGFVALYAVATVIKRMRS